MYDFETKVIRFIVKKILPNRWFMTWWILMTNEYFEYIRFWPSKGEDFKVMVGAINEFHMESYLSSIKNMEELNLETLDKKEVL